MKEKFESHQREYNLVSITACATGIFSPEYTKFFGHIESSELVEIIKDGVFYWVARPDEFKQPVKILMERVGKGKFDLALAFRDYSKGVKRFEDLLSCNPKDYSLETLDEFYNLYSSLFKYIIYGAYGIDYLAETVGPAKRKTVERLLTRTRLLGERIHKDGEKIFLPRYLKWLSQNILTDYAAEELRYVTFYEMRDFLQSGRKLPSVKELAKRKKLCLLYIRKGSHSLLVGKEAREFIKKHGIFKKEKISPTKIISGQPAFRGKVKGKARLVLSSADIPKFRKGEIIVSQMTDPHYLPIMKKAAAFVTDEGGLLCHAAIVARELKKPCIIGTKIATKVLKDGDLVEVDADCGVIKILK